MLPNPPDVLYWIAVKLGFGLFGFLFAVILGEFFTDVGTGLITLFKEEKEDE